MIVKRGDLQREFARVRRVFFPRWDRKREWHVRWFPDLCGADGKCFRGTKVIGIAHGVRMKDLTLVLIHESAHAVVFGGENERWKARMRRAAQKAEKLGENRLAKQIQAEVRAYRRQSAISFDPSYVQDRMEDIASENPAVTFDAAVAILRRECAATEADFLKHFGKAARAGWREGKRLPRLWEAARARRTSTEP
jgi:hypothetical protein